MDSSCLYICEKKKNKRRGTRETGTRGRRGTRERGNRNRERRVDERKKGERGSTAGGGREAILVLIGKVI
jgi:hypothetical protein